MRQTQRTPGALTVYWRYLRGGMRSAAPTVTTDGEVELPLASLKKVEIPSAEVILTVALAERDHRIGAISGLETKVGIIFGFATVMVTLIAGLAHVAWWMRLIAAFPAVIGGAACLLALRTRAIGALKLDALRDHYLTEAPEWTATMVVNRIIRDSPHVDRAIAFLAATVTIATVALSVSAVFALVLALLPA
jgi:hypothetical protein